MKVPRLLALVAFMSRLPRVSSSVDLSTLDYKTFRAICSRGLPLTIRELELQCCHKYKERFRRYWYSGGRYFSDYLEFLRTWRCPELKQECDERPYSFTEFNRLTYDRFCNRTVMKEKCIPVLSEVIGETGSISTNTETLGEIGNYTQKRSGEQTTKWEALVDNLDFISMRIEDVVKPCVQVAQLDAPNGGFGSYQEILKTDNPFCSIVWCGFSSSIFDHKEGIRPFDCMSSFCKANQIVMMVIVVLLSLCISIANLLLIVIFCTTKKLQNSQAIYKISLAAADFLVGSFVLPTFAVNLSQMNLQLAKKGGVYKARLANSSDPFIDWSQVPMPGRDGKTVHYYTGFFIQTYSNVYKNVAGVVTTLSICVSVYSLTLAGLDRVLAVCYPLRYRKINTKKLAVRLCIGIWIVATIISLLPLMLPHVKYDLYSTMLFAIGGPQAYIMYIVALLAPLLMVWINSIIVYIAVRRQRCRRRQLGTVRQNNETENRLAITLTIIVGVLTLSAMPAVVMSLLTLGLTDLNLSDPAHFDQHKYAMFNSFDFVAGLILMANSLWNFFIYNARNKDFKQAVKDFWRRMKRTETSL